MWHAISPPQLTQSAPPTGEERRYTTTAADRTSIPNGDGTSNVYVHHINHGIAPPPPQQQPQQQMPQMMGIPFAAAPPVPMPYPYPYPPPPASYGCPYNNMQQQQQQQQPRVIIMKQEEEKKDDKKDKKKDKKDDKKEEKKAEPTPEPNVKEAPKEEPKSSKPQKASKFSIVSGIFFAFALIFGTACIVELYQADDARQESLETEFTETYDGLYHTNDHTQAYSTNRTIALSLGCTSVICFTVGTLCSFYAGMRHRAKSKGKEHCCLAGFLIASWIIYSLAAINSLIILVLAFNPDNIIYPEVVVVGFVANMLAWMLMFGYSELARR